MFAIYSYVRNNDPRAKLVSPLHKSILWSDFYVKNVCLSLCDYARRFYSDNDFKGGRVIQLLRF